MLKKFRTRIFLIVAILVSLSVALFIAVDSGLIGDGDSIESRSVRKTVRTYAEANDISFDEYPESLLALLERNPETKDFVLSYPIEKDKKHEIDLSDVDCESVPLFLQWDKRWGYTEYGSDVSGLTACGPVCLSMCAYYLTGDKSMSPDNIIDFAIKNDYYVKGSGSLWTLISEGGEKLGLDVEELPLVKQKIVDNLESGNPVICVMGEGHFTSTGHFIVLTGVADNGEFTVNDPNSIANSEKTWSYETICGEIKNLWAVSVP
ncbi:MAG: C39 family peptidase [Clostridia bacterium]|nr:C39 family peptidase [Clostridia bacterium]